MSNDLSQGLFPAVDLAGNPLPQEGNIPTVEYNGYKIANLPGTQELLNKYNIQGATNPQIGAINVGTPEESLKEAEQILTPAPIS